MKVFEGIILGAGLLLFAGLVYHVGPDTLLRDLSLVGIGFAFVFAQEFAAFLFNTLGWRYAIPPMSRGVALMDLLGMRMAGDAVNYVTPSASIGGEFVKARLLQRRVPAAEAVGSVSLAAINQFLSQIIFILVSVSFFASEAPIPVAPGLGFGLCAFLVLVCAAFAWLSWRQDLFRRIHVFVVKQGWFRQWAENEDIWRKLDEGIFGSFRRHPIDNALSVLFFTLGWGMGAVEIFLILYFLQVPCGWATAVEIEGLSMLIDMLFFFVPAKIGSQEGGKYAIFLLLGLNPESGFALGVVRRLREIAWTLIGFLAFGYYQYSSLRGDRRAGRDDLGFAPPE